jgi:hypothetical protein
MATYIAGQPVLYMYLIMLTIAEQSFREAATMHVHWRTLVAVAERFLGVGCSLITSLVAPNQEKPHTTPPLQYLIYSIYISVTVSGGFPLSRVSGLWDIWLHLTLRFTKHKSKILRGLLSYFFEVFSCETDELFFFLLRKKYCSAEAMLHGGGVISSSFESQSRKH